MKKTLKRSLIMTLVAVLLIGTFAVTAEAAMKRTVKKQDETTKISTANKKAAKVKKGTTNLTFTKGQGYLKFVAPKTKTYSFTFSNMKVKGGNDLGMIRFNKKDKLYPKELTQIEVSTKGGKTEYITLMSTGWKELKKGKTVDHMLHKRTAKTKLKKGEALYIYFDTIDGNKTNVKLVIK